MEMDLFVNGHRVVHFDFTEATRKWIHTASYDFLARLGPIHLHALCVVENERPNILLENKVNNSNGHKNQTEK